MVYSIGLVLILGFILGFLFERIKLPKIIGMIFIGILMSPSLFDLLDPSLLNISASLRQIALVIVLTRAGLSLDLDRLKAIGRPAILLSFLPATFEIIGIVIFGPLLFGISLPEAILLGSVIAAVSPAIIVPRMIDLKKKRFGEEKKIPEMILAGASLDDIYVIIIFYATLGLVQSNSFNALALLNIPTSIILGITLGFLVSLYIIFIFKKFKFSIPIQVLWLVGVSFLMIGLEEALKPYLEVSALLGVMTMGMMVLFKLKDEAIKLEIGYQKMWVFFEIILFVLVGASVDINYIWNFGLLAVLLIFGALSFRIFGVYLALIKTGLDFKEKLFVAISYLPKATVQAAIGGIALSNGLAIGNLILTMAVLSIVITAPIGAILIDNTYNKLLILESIHEDNHLIN
ncbi:cation:proton antiporter [Acholeplasma equirhinis]|uniref:cation:proton antiporter n=1 Tax=Acholeplasma equirhinis TaxID=555393 RepID=UPI001F09CDE2|nr:cation:proton antiporter [Acholeplasma equirhinis]